MNVKLIFLLFITATTFSQVNFSVIVKQDYIAINDVFEIDFVANKAVEKFIAPSFSDFEIIDGPSQEINHSWDNGKSKFSKTYSFSLKPKTIGKLTISKAKVSFESKDYTTKPISLDIITLEKKIKKEMTALWSNKDDSKLILVDNNLSNQFSYRKIKFYLSKNNQISLVDSQQVLPSILLKDALKIEELKKQEYDLSTAWYLYGEYKVLKLQKPQNNQDLIFELSYDTGTKRDKELQEAIDFLHTYTNKKLIFEYVDGKFILKK